jgi:RelB antitoxin
MATKKVEKLGTSRAASSSSSLKGKASDAKDRPIDPIRAVASGSRSIKGANSPKSTASSKGVCPTKPHVPNATTIKAIREADAGENMTRYESVEEMLKDLEG